MKPLEFWQGEGGTQYTARNRVDWRARIPFWREVIELTGARSVYEVGCNVGWNLSAIRRAFADIELYGIDVNTDAIIEAWRAGFPRVRTMPYEGKFGLVFTVGVLIHQSPEELRDFMCSAVIEKSAQWVLAVEYAANVETEIEYRGQSGLLWKRPYGELYQDLGLKLVREWDAGPAFDQCTAWLMEIPR